MTTMADAVGDDGTTPTAIDPGADRASRRWRAVWRIHFYAGVIGAPFLVLMALTGLVILYTQPIDDALQGDLRRVTDTGEFVSFDQQAVAVEAAHPDDPIVSMTMPRDGETSTIFSLASEDQVFVNPYTAEVLGSRHVEDGVVRLANRLHGNLNNLTLTVPLPTVSALWDGGDVMRDYVVGDVVLEILGCWTIVLVMSGIFLWWPRASRARRRSDRRPFAIRWRSGGRARWRDLHAVPGIVLSFVLLFALVSGMPWSSYWGANFTALANEISPNVWTDAPASSQVTKGDLDRLGNSINWNTGDIGIPASLAGESDATRPSPISLDTVVAVAGQEGMEPGWTASFPVNDVDEAGNPVWGSFVVSNSWPRKTGEARDVFVDQFSGATLGQQDVYGYGSVSRAVDTLVSTHMGTQLGIVSRIMMTLVSVLTIWSVISAVVMYAKRRRHGLGLPRRPHDVRLANGLAVIAVVVGILYPLWGVTAVAVLALDRFVVRRTPRLRALFGQR